MEVDMKVAYQCCFCGQGIESRVPDVGGLLYTTAIDRHPDDQQEQQLYCHTRCLSQRLHSSVKLYVVDLLETVDVLGDDC